MRGNSRNTRKIALNGILGALTVVCVLLASVLPTNKLSLFALSSFFIAAVIIESGVMSGWLFFVATSLLSLIIVPEKLAVVPYFIFFGIYGLVKLYIEKINKPVIEYLLKFAHFNICVGIALISLKHLFGFNLTVKLPWWLLLVVLEIAFFIYDVVYTMFISYYRDKLRPKLRI